MVDGVQFGKFENVNALQEAANKELDKIGRFSTEGSVSIFGEEGLQEGSSKDDFLNKMTQEIGFSDDVAQGLWDVVNIDAEGKSADTIDADELEQLLEMYGSDRDGAKENFSFVNSTSLLNHLAEPRKANSKTEEKEADKTEEANKSENAQDASMNNITGKLDELDKELEDEVAKSDKTDDKKEADETKTNKSMAEIFEANPKVKQDENGQYYIESEEWDANASDNLDCTSRIIKNIYGVDYDSKEGQAILEKLTEANPDFFKNGVESIPSNAKLNLIDASEILGLEVDEADEANETDEADGTNQTEETQGTDNTDKTQSEFTKDDITIAETDADKNWCDQLASDFLTAMDIANGKTEGGEVMSSEVNEDGTSKSEIIALENGHYVMTYSTKDDAGDEDFELSQAYIYNSIEDLQEGKNSATLEKDENGKLTLTPLLNEDGSAVNPTEGEDIAEDESAPEEEQGQTEEAQEQTADEAKLRADVANARAAQLHAAMDRLGTDEDGVYDILDNVSGQSLVDVMNAYEEAFGESLEDAIKGDFSGKTESRLLNKLDTAQQIAQALGGYNKDDVINETIVQEAQANAFTEATTARAGTDEKVVINMLQGGQLSDEDIINLASTLQAQGKDIVSIIKKEFSFGSEDMLLARLAALGIQ